MRLCGKNPNTFCLFSWIACHIYVTKQKRRSKTDGTFKALTMTISDALETAIDASDDVDIEAGDLVIEKHGLQSVFVAAREAVADVESGNIGPTVFDTALQSATDALDNSSVCEFHEEMDGVVSSLPDYIIGVAARQAANDLFYQMPTKAKTRPSMRLLDKMKTVAVSVAKTRLDQDDCAQMIQTVTEESMHVADNATSQAAAIIRKGVPIHAAASAVFGVAIRDVPPRHLADAIEEACQDLPEMACRHDSIVVGFVTALSVLFFDGTVYRRKYQTATRGVENISRDEAAIQIVNTISDCAFEAVYKALVTSVYATSVESVFESDYESALAAACGVDERKIRQDEANDMPVDILVDSPEDIPEEVLQEMYQRLSHAMNYLSDTGDSVVQQKTFVTALGVDYKTAVSENWMSGIISLYEAAYKAGYRGAHAASGRKRRSR